MCEEHLVDPRISMKNEYSVEDSPKESGKDALLFLMQPNHLFKGGVRCHNGLLGLKKV